MKATKGKVIFASTSPNEIQSLTNLFIKGGYEIICTDFTTIFEYIKKYDPFAILIHLENLENNVFQICKVLRAHEQFNKTTILILSDFNSEDTIIRSFDSGVDFFITKPVSARLLLSKIDAVNRKYNSSIKNISPLGNIIIDKESYSVLYNNKSIFFPPKQFELLYLLISRNGRIVHRSEILTQVWGGNQIDFRTIDAHIYNIRQKLGKNSIKTVKGVGYKMSIS